MPYKDPDAQRRYQREWQQKRRRAWFSGRVCVQCGASENLVIHHRDEASKISHRIWSWTLERREAELEKCEVLCETCHDALHQAAFPHGTGAHYRHGCRCSECREAHRLRLKAQQDRKLVATH